MEHASPRTFSTSNVIVYLYVEAMFEFDSVFRIDYACIYMHSSTMHNNWNKSSVLTSQRPRMIYLLNV